MAIRSAIQSGDVDRAMERVNDLNPEILETNPSLYFHLQQQRLIELIRQGKVVLPLCPVPHAAQQLIPCYGKGLMVTIDTLLQLRHNN